MPNREDGGLPEMMATGEESFRFVFLEAVEGQPPLFTSSR